MIENTFSRLLGTLAASTLAFLPIAAQAQDAAPLQLPQNVQFLNNGDSNVRRATAVVNGTVITGTDVDHRMALLLAASDGQLNAEQMQQVRTQVLRNLIDETLQMQAANAQEMAVDNAMVDQRYAEVAARNFGNTADAIDKMNAQLIAMGSSPASLKRQIRGELSWQRVLQRNVTPFINVSDEEVRDVLKRMEEQQGEAEFRIGEIYLAATPETAPAVAQNAAQIVEQIRQGGNFTAYARQFSNSSTAAVGGDLGFVRLETLPDAMAAQARQMQPGELVGPFEIPGGFIIMLLIDKRQIAMADPRDAMLSLKQIGISVPAGASEAQVGAALQRFSSAVQSMRGCGDAEAVAQTIGAQVDASSDIRARDLPAELQSRLLQMQIGQSTPPFGTVEDGFRVLMLCGRDDPAGGGLPDFEAVRDQIEQERIGKRAQRYLRDLRNDAYIEYS